MGTDHAPFRRFVLVGLALLTTACGSSPAQPTRNALTITASSPTSGTLTVPSQYLPYNFFGGLMVPKGSSVVSVSVTMTAGADVPWARLSVYLLRNGSTTDYCGENGPDSPSWQFITPGWSQSYTVTGFRLVPLPCDVTGIRAMLHMRNNGLVGPPTASETVAEATIPASFRIQY